MTIGGSIALAVIGAVLRWAVTWSPAYVNLRLVGLILLLGGIVGLIISLAVMFARRRSSAPAGDGYRDGRYHEPPRDGYREDRYNEPPAYRDGR